MRDDVDVGLLICKRFGTVILSIIKSGRKLQIFQRSDHPTSTEEREMVSRACEQVASRDVSYGTSGG